MRAPEAEIALFAGIPTEQPIGRKLVPCPACLLQCDDRSHALSHIAK
jgi:hypothetical protein